MQQGSFTELDLLGKRLSLEIGCSVRWSYDKSVFVCRHHVVFPVSNLQDSSDWAWVKEEHSKAVRG